MKIFFFTIVFITFLSCSDSEKSSNPEIKSVSATELISQNKPINEELREYLTNLKGKDRETLDTIITILDEHNLSFCDYIKRLMQLDDSCAAVGNRMYPNPGQQEKLNKFLNKAVEQAELNYSKSLGLTKHSLEFAGTFYAFDSEARRLCGNFPSYESNY